VAHRPRAAPSLRPAARAEKAAAEEAAALAGVPDASDLPGIPWPARDLERSAPEIQWSFVPETDADEDARPRRRAGVPLGAIGLIALAAVVMVGTYALATNLGFMGVAVVPTASPAGHTTPVAAPTSSSVPPTELPSSAPTVEPSAPPPPSLAPSGDPAEMAAMQQAAWETLEALRTAATTGDVAAAQPLLGDTAPGLRSSGLRRATFPELDATAITIEVADAGYLATAGADRLTSTDGAAWTFDYANRPLAAYRSPSGEPIHDLWWVESDGEHHLFVRVSVATLSRSGVSVDVHWSFDPARPGDATYFRRATVVISSATLDGAAAEVAASALPMDGLTTLTATAMLTGVDVVGGVPARLAIGLTFTNPRTATSEDRGIETIFALDVR
jgi:hypothetical protein